MTAALRFLVELPGIEPGVDALMVYRGDSLSLDLIDEWGLNVRGLDGVARV
jgi:hypothetical protein